jgi:NADH-quinone oxidoreductase subunit I
MGKISIWERVRIPTYNNPQEVHHGAVDIDSEKCKGCQLCVKVCPANSLITDDMKARMVSPQFNYCISCSCCVAICPENAITLTSQYKYTKHFKTIERGDALPPRLYTL